MSLPTRCEIEREEALDRLSETDRRFIEWVEETPDGEVTASDRMAYHDILEAT